MKDDTIVLDNLNRLLSLFYGFKRFFHSHQAVVIAEPVEHVLVTAPRGRFGVTCKGGEGFVDFLCVDLLRKLAETDYQQGDAVLVV